jgi:putative NADH-flavin reductase
MKLVVLGATGGTGIEVIRQAVGRGHTVTAFVRSTAPLERYKDRITIKEGDLLDSAQLQRIIKGHDAVISAFGPNYPNKKGDKLVSKKFAVALTAAMPPAGVKRLVTVSSALLFKDSVLPPTYAIGRVIFPDIFDDVAGMETAVRQSLTDWTVIRASRLTDRPFTGKYRVKEGHLPPYGFSLSRADLADCIIKVIDNPVRFDKVLGISA